MFLLLAISASLCICTCASSAHNLTEKQVREYVFPKEMSEWFPYYLSGYDEEGTPIFVSEYGKWDFRRYVDQGGEHLKNLSIYYDQLCYNFIDEAKKAPTKQMLGIGDLEGFDIRQAASFQTAAFIISKFAVTEKLLSGRHVKKIFMLNSNFLFEQVWKLGSPLLGSLNDIVEFYGSNKEAWKPKVLREIPREQLPEWYGGVTGHRPVKIFG